VTVGERHVSLVLAGLLECKTGTFSARRSCCSYPPLVSQKARLSRGWSVIDCGSCYCTLIILVCWKYWLLSISLFVRLLLSGNCLHGQRKAVSLCA